jgi:hypothetical protein
MELSDGRRKPLRRARSVWSWLRWPAAIGALFVVGLMALNGLVSAADPGSPDLRVTRELSGTVTIVNYNAAKFCLDPDGTNVQFCSVSYQRVGSAPLVVGQHVTGSVAMLATGPSVSMEVFVLTDPQPAP